MLFSFIIIAEISFWILILLGLTFRYLLRLPKLGLLFFALTPLLDLILLIITATDLKNGHGQATFFHGLAGVYIGVSVAFGHSMIRWADRKFANWIGKETSYPAPPKFGLEHAQHERKMWFLHLLAWGIGSGILYLLSLWMGNTERTGELLSIIPRWGVVLLIDFAISFNYTLWPKRKPS